MLENDNKLNNFVNRYVKGEYHCDQCPYCWVDYGYDDADAGCYIYGELRDTCRLLPPFRAAIGGIRKKKDHYYQNHQYDGMGEWYLEQEGRQKKFDELIASAFDRRRLEVSYKGSAQSIPSEKIPYILETWRILSDYEEFAHPIISKSVKEKWKDALMSTVRWFGNKIKPYFCK